MRYSNFFIPTLKEEPTEAEIPSHSLCLRAGLIRKVASGIYSFLPLGFRVLRKIEDIVRDEMNKAGAIELLLPAIQPSELWIKSGRWSEYGPEMFRLKDRSNRDFCLGPTHEELITYLAYLDIKSYKDLPINLYQIQVKFRDEIRPRYGLLRAREFIMKDAYSFCRDEEELDEVYKKMYRAYSRILERIGLNFKVVEAKTGVIGGKYSHEFIVLAKNGEEKIVYCPGCNYSSGYELSRFVPGNNKDSRDEEKPGFEERVGEVFTPDITTIESLVQFLKVPVDRIVKTILLKDKENNIYAFLLGGERELNIGKAQDFLNKELKMIGEEDVENNLNSTGLNIGYLGPINLPCHIKILADNSIKKRKNFVVGANKKNYHLINVNYPRDFVVDSWGDFSYPVPGDICINCGSKLEFERGIEVGHIFKLGEKYSLKLEAKFLDKDGKLKPFVMGCYGIGISRIMAAAIEQLHDDKGIVWPSAIAPFAAEIVVTNPQDDRLTKVAEEIYSSLTGFGVEVIYDDRDTSPGIKFKDADLMGIPLKIIIGKKFLDKGKIEVEFRKNSHKEELIPADISGIVRYINQSL
ncbi:MAG: proline--tRNA ligase [Actinobacteria bacterium]|nr:proline--tRNA ligase [Actinomycetota bacterium]